MKFSSEPPTAALFFVGKSRHRDQNFRARSKNSIEIENFDRDQIFLIVGPCEKKGEEEDSLGMLGADNCRRLDSEFFNYCVGIARRSACKIGPLWYREIGQAIPLSHHWPGRSAEMCRGFCHIKFGKLCQGFSWKIFLCTFSPQN